MAAPIGKPKILSSAERRAALGGSAAHKQAAATMAGEQVRTVEPEAESTPALLTAPAAEQESAPAAGLASVEPTPEPAVVVPDELASVPVAAATPVELSAELLPPVAKVSSAPAPARRAGRKPAPADTATAMETEHAVKIPESVWKDIKMSLAFLADVPDAPGSIKKYLVEAHRLYDAHLRKHGKLPAKQGG